MKKKFYIIGVPSSYGMGLMAIVFEHMSNIIWAVKNNYIPIVDMMHYNNPYFKDNREFRDNVWEYYFEQPCNITLNDIYEDSEVIISSNDWFEKSKMIDFGCLDGSKNPFNLLFIRKYKKAFYKKHPEYFIIIKIIIKNI